MGWCTKYKNTNSLFGEGWCTKYKNTNSLFGEGGLSGGCRCTSITRAIASLALTINCLYFLIRELEEAIFDTVSHLHWTRHLFGTE